MTASEGVRKAMLRFYDLFSAGDVDAFAGQIASDGAFVVGTDWDQWSFGRDAWIDAYSVQMKETPGLQFRAGDKLWAFEEGAVGWAADQLDIVLPDDEGTTIPVRATAVLRQEAGDWKMVHLHMSFGVPDAKLFDLLPQLLS